MPTLTVWVEGIPVPTLLDSGSTVTLARPTILPKRVSRNGTITVSCIHRDVQEVPAVEVQIQGRAGTWPLLLGVIPDLPVPLYLFTKPISSVFQQVNQQGNFGWKQKEDEALLGTGASGQNG